MEKEGIKELRDVLVKSRMSMSNRIKSKEIVDDIEKQLSLCAVSNRRELLVGFFDWFEKTYPDYSFADIDREVDVDEYLKNKCTGLINKI